MSGEVRWHLGGLFPAEWANQVERYIRHGIRPGLERQNRCAIAHSGAVCACARQHHTTDHTQRRSRSGVGWPPCCNLPVRLPLKDNHNLFVALREAFPADLDAVAIECADGEPLVYTWRDLDRGTARMANLLASLDLPAGSRVAVQTEKSVEALMLYLAVLRAGLVYLPLNTAYQSGEIEYFIGDAEPAVVVCSSRSANAVREAARKAHGHGVPHVLTLDADRSGSLLEQAARQSDAHQAAVKETDELAAIVYTSGTTGRSKGAMLTHGNLLSNARTLKDYWRWRSPAAGGDVLIHALPIFHVHGLFVASMAR